MVKICTFGLQSFTFSYFLQALSSEKLSILSYTGCKLIIPYIQISPVKVDEVAQMEEENKRIRDEIESMERR